MGIVGLLVVVLNMIAVMDRNPITRPVRGQYGASKQIEKDDAT